MADGNGPVELVDEFLEPGRRDFVEEAAWDGWEPGKPWDLRDLTPLGEELGRRCAPVPPGDEPRFERSECVPD